MVRPARQLAIGIVCLLVVAAAAATTPPRAPARAAVDDPQTAELLAYGGRWELGRVGSATPLCTVVLTRTAGRYGHVLRACHPNEAFWRLERGKLVFLSAGGARTTVFTRRNANLWQGAFLGTPSLPAGGIVHYLRRRGGTAAPDTALEAELLARAGKWRFGRVGEARPLCAIVLTRDPGRFGRIIRACHPNESFWRLQGEQLLFLDAAGKVTTRFARLGPTSWRGPFLGTPAGIVHYLRR